MYLPRRIPGEGGLPENKRVVGRLAGIAIVAGSMLGVGIFLTPPLVAQYIQDPAWYMAAWLFGGVIAYSGAVAYAELATRYPEAGGDYVFIHHAFGPSLSFAAGTLLYFGVFAGSIATVAVPIADYLMPPFLSQFGVISPEHSLYSIGIIDLTVSRLAGIALIVLLATINIIGTRISINVQIVCTLLPMIMLVAVFFYVFTSIDIISTAGQSSSDSYSVPFMKTGPAILAIYFAYSGWNAATYVAGDIKNPAQTIPYSLVWGTIGITILYLIVAGGLFYMAGPDMLSETADPVSYVAAAISSTSGIYLITAMIGFALLASLNGTILAGGRVGYSMASYGSLFREAGRLSPKYGTPYISITGVSAIAILYVLTGTFEWLLEFTSLTMFLLSGLTVVSLYVIRNRSNTNAPYMARGYPWFPGLILMLSVAIIMVNLYRALFGESRFTADSLYPLSGIVLFLLVWLGHRYISVRGQSEKS